MVTTFYGNDTKVEKLDCTWRAQKRLGKALYGVVADQKTKKFVVNSAGNLLHKTVANKSRGEKMYKGIGGVQRLTKKKILSIQGHFWAVAE